MQHGAIRGDGSGEPHELSRRCDSAVRVRSWVAEAIQFYAPEARPVISDAVQAAIDAGTPFDLELPLVTGQGRRI